MVETLSEPSLTLPGRRGRNGMPDGLVARCKQRTPRADPTGCRLLLDRKRAPRGANLPGFHAAACIKGRSVSTRSVS